MNKLFRSVAVTCVSGLPFAVFAGGCNSSDGGDAASGGSAATSGGRAAVGGGPTGGRTSGGSSSGGSHAGSGGNQQATGGKEAGGEGGQVELGGMAGSGSSPDQESTFWCGERGCIVGKEVCSVTHSRNVPVGVPGGEFYSCGAIIDDCKSCDCLPNFVECTCSGSQGELYRNCQQI